MSNVRRVYAEKKKDFAVQAKELQAEIKSYLGIKTVTGVRVLIRYDIENISDETYKRALGTVFSEPPVDDLYEENFDLEGGKTFSVEFLPGQFDQRADSAVQCVKFLKEDEEPVIRTAVTYMIEGQVSDEEFSKIKSYCINPVDSRETGMEKPDTLITVYDDPADVAIFDGFRDMDESSLKALYESLGLAMTFKDFKHIQNYFHDDEKRDPSMTEIRVLDTYWSDHCRHTTFGTILDDVQIDDEVVQAAFDRYMAMRKDLGRENKPRCMMDLATIGAKELKKQGILKNLDESEEINACTVKIKCDVNGKDEDWLFLFKNETHNHPTEIEPFGGAATCIGGAMTGLGGLYLVMNAASGVGGAWVYNCIDGYGWLAVALVIFAVWSPKRALWCSLIFGGLACMRYYYPISFIPASIYDIVPYIVTAIVLVAVSLKHSRANQPPESLGLSYFREER